MCPVVSDKMTEKQEDVFASSFCSMQEKEFMAML